MYEGPKLNSDVALKDLSELFRNEFKDKLAEFNIELVFETLLEYYTGACSLVVQMNSDSKTKGRVEMIYMVDCYKEDFLEGSERLYSFFNRKIVQPYMMYFKLSKIIAEHGITKTVFIKDSVINEAILAIRLGKDQIFLDVNGPKLLDSLESGESDLKNLIQCLALGLGGLT